MAKNTNTNQEDKKRLIKNLVELQISKNIIKNFADIDLSIFYDSLFEDRYYSKQLIPIGFGEYSDDPLILAKMINYLQPKENDRILEVGTGSGFSTALLSLMCREVYTIEFNEELAVSAKNRLYNHGYENIRFFAGDASVQTNTINERFDGIIMHAACFKRPFTIMTLLKNKASIIFPMGPPIQQQIIALQNYPNLDTEENFRTQFLDFVQCTPMQGPYGYDTPNIPEVYRDFDDEDDDDEDQQQR